MMSQPEAQLTTSVFFSRGGEGLQQQCFGSAALLRTSSGDQLCRPSEARQMCQSSGHKSIDSGVVVCMCTYVELYAEHVMQAWNIKRNEQHRYATCQMPHVLMTG